MARIDGDRFVKSSGRRIRVTVLSPGEGPGEVNGSLDVVELRIVRPDVDRLFDRASRIGKLAQS